MARSRPDSIDELVRAALGRRGRDLDARELARLRTAFLAAGRAAVQARTGTAAQAAEAMRHGRRLLATGRARLAATTPTGTGPVMVDASWRRLERVLDRHRARLSAIPEVVGFGLGFRRRDGVPTDERVIVLYVDRKLEPQDLRAERRSLLGGTIQSRGVSVPVDVVELGEIRHHLHAGETIGADGDPEYGTIGVFARHVATGRPVALTAMHVTGHPTDAPNGANVRLAAPCFGRSGSAVIGTLLRGFYRPADAAAIRLRPEVRPSNEIPAIGSVTGWRPVDLPGDFGTAVYLFGATSGFLSGTIREPAISLPKFGLDRAILADIATAGGDSGSALVDNQNLVLGLLVGESTAHASLRVFAPMGIVLDLLGCDLP